MDLVLRRRTRRHLLKLAAAGAAFVPTLSPFSTAQAGDVKGDNGPPYNSGADCKNDGTKCSCFLRGTHIGTPIGEIPVEQLRRGDEVCTIDGVRTIKWIGYTTLHASNEIIEGLTPVRVERFALDDTTPVRDLYLSPGHCLFADGVLIPVEYLINGTTISYHAHSEDEWIEYYHVEFDRHEVVFAEGMTVESYRGVERINFQNRGEYELLYGGSAREKSPYAPIAGYHGGFRRTERACPLNHLNRRGCPGPDSERGRSD